MQDVGEILVAQHEAVCMRKTFDGQVDRRAPAAFRG